MADNSLLKMHIVGFKQLQKDIARSASPAQLSKARRAGLKKSAMVIIRRAKKEYLRSAGGSVSSRAASFFRERRLGKLTGNLASNMTFKIIDRRYQAKVGWWRHPYAGVVAEPPDNRAYTIIKPRKAKALWFPLTKKARNVWHMRKSAESWTIHGGAHAGTSAMKIGSAILWFGRDYTIASQAKIKPRHPLRRSLADMIDTINRILFNEYEVLGRKLK